MTKFSRNARRPFTVTRVQYSCESSDYEQKAGTPTLFVMARTPGEAIKKVADRECLIGSATVGRFRVGYLEDGAGVEHELIITKDFYATVERVVSTVRKA